MTRRTATTLVLAMGTALCGCGGHPPARTEAAPPPPSTGAEATAPTAEGPITDAEISAFADTTIQLVALEQQGRERVQNGEDVEQVRAALAPQVQEIFESSSLTRERFDEIAQRAGRDEALRQRIEAQLEEKMRPPA